MSSDLNKVLFVTFDVVPDPTGSSARTTEFLRALTPFFDVHVLTAKTPEHAHIERYHGARLLRVPVGEGDVRSRGEAFDRAVRRQLKSEEYDLACFTDPFGGYAVCEGRQAQGYKLIYAPIGFPSIELKYTDPQLETDRPFITKLRRQEIFCLMNADLIFIQTAVGMDHVVSLGVPRSKMRLVPAIVDLSDFQTDKPPTNDPPQIVYVGSQASWQGLPALLFALRVAKKKTNLRVRIVGPSHGSWLRQLQDMIREFELREVTTLEVAVPHEDIPHILADADIGVAPLQKGDRNQVQGGSPMKIAEYMACGRPVIAGDLPMTREMLEDGKQGLLYPPSDEDALAEKIVQLCEDPELRATMGAAARVRAQELFDAQHLRAIVVKVFQELLSPSIIVSEEAFDGAMDDAPPDDDSDGPTITLPPSVAGEAPTGSVSIDEMQRISGTKSNSDPDTGTGPSRPAHEPETRPGVQAPDRVDTGEASAPTEAADAATTSETSLPEPTPIVPPGRDEQGEGDTGAAVASAGPPHDDASDGDDPAPTPIGQPQTDPSVADAPAPSLESDAERNEPTPVGAAVPGETQESDPAIPSQDPAPDAAVPATESTASVDSAEASGPDDDDGPVEIDPDDAILISEGPTIAPALAKSRGPVKRPPPPVMERVVPPKEGASGEKSAKGGKGNKGGSKKTKKTEDTSPGHKV